MVLWFIQSQSWGTENRLIYAAVLTFDSVESLHLKSGEIMDILLISDYLLQPQIDYRRHVRNSVCGRESRSW